VARPPVIPLEALADLGVPTQAHKVVFAALCAHLPNEPPWLVWPSNPVLADMGGVSRRAVQRALDYYQAKGWLTVDYDATRPKRRRTIHLHPPFVLCRGYDVGDTGGTSPVTQGLPSESLTDSDRCDTRDAGGATPVTQGYVTRDVGGTSPVSHRKDHSRSIPEKEEDQSPSSDSVPEAPPVPNPIELHPWAKMRERWNGIAARFPGIERLHTWKVKGDRRRHALVARAKADGRTPAQVWEWICLCVEGDSYYNGSGARKPGTMQNWQVTVKWALDESRGWLSLNEKFDRQGKRTGGRGQARGQQALFGGITAAAQTDIPPEPFYLADKAGNSHNFSGLNALYREQIKGAKRTVTPDALVSVAEKLLAHQREESNDAGPENGF